MKLQLTQAQAQEFLRCCDVTMKNEFLSGQKKVNKKYVDFRCELAIKLDEVEERSLSKAEGY